MTATAVRRMVKMGTIAPALLLSGVVVVLVVVVVVVVVVLVVVVVVFGSTSLMLLGSISLQLSLLHLQRKMLKRGEKQRRVTRIDESYHQPPSHCHYPCECPHSPSLVCLHQDCCSIPVSTWWWGVTISQYHPCCSRTQSTSTWRPWFSCQSRI